MNKPTDNEQTILPSAEAATLEQPSVQTAEMGNLEMEAASSSDADALGQTADALEQTADALEQTAESSARTTTQRHHSSHTVLENRDNALGFDVDWDKVEENYKHRRKYRRRHHSHHGKKKKKSDEKKKWSRKKKICMGILIFFSCVIIGVIAAFFIMRYVGRQTLLNFDNIKINVPYNLDYKNGGKTIYYKDHTYRINKNIACILFMGVDNTEFKENAVAGTAGQADALYLFAYDTSNGRTRVLCLNRDTMTDISRYDKDGNYYDTSTEQLCLAYAYGDGKKLSAENQVTAVERLIYNIPIRAYYAIDLSAIKILNDDVGGVTLTPEYTFGSFTKGQQITIKGDMAEEFVRYRNVTLLDDNLRRMACQRQYIDAFANRIIPSIREDFTTPIQLYQDSSKYTVTNITPTVLTYLASTAAFKHSGLELITTEGKYVTDAESPFPEYKLNKKKFFETFLDLFYNKID